MTERSDSGTSPPDVPSAPSRATEYLTCVAFSPDGPTLASAPMTKPSDSGISPPHAPSAPSRATRVVICVAFSPDGPTLASALRRPHCPTTLGSRHRARPPHLRGPLHPAVSVAFSPDGADPLLPPPMTPQPDSGISPPRARSAASRAIPTASPVSPSAPRANPRLPRPDTMRLWDLATARALRAFEGHTIRSSCRLQP